MIQHTSLRLLTKPRDLGLFCIRLLFTKSYHMATFVYARIIP
jgi:hypothetical protein